MEKIILGMLMLHGMTVYEMKSLISKKLGSVCSSSSGSIHTALKKLLQKNHVTLRELEGKKIYCITSLGAESFKEWIECPIKPGKSTNIEFGKLFFLGIGNPKKRNELIIEHIKELKKEYIELQQIQLITKSMEKEILESSQKTIVEDTNNEEGIKANLCGRSLEEMVRDVYHFQLATLQYGIDSIRFEMDWFEAYMKEEKE